MRKFSIEPDEHMKWIYDQNHRDYNSDRAQDLRERISRCIAQVQAKCPWLLPYNYNGDAQLAAVAQKDTEFFS